MNTEEKKEKKNITEKKKKSTPCESCFYYDEETEECSLDLDEDELYRFEMRGYSRTMTCSYYKFYDEYKSVQKQN